MTEKEKFAENVVLSFVPWTFRSFMKSMPDSGISKRRLGLLFGIYRQSGMPMSYYCEKMMVRGPNLTTLAGKLIADGLIERTFDPEDRDITRLNELFTEIKYIMEKIV